jgi:predicted transport protein
MVGESSDTAARSRSSALVNEQGRGGKREYPLSRHLDNKSRHIVDLVERVHLFGCRLGPDVTRRVRKQYIGYYRGRKSFFTLVVQRRRVVVYLALDPTEIRDTGNAGVTRDVTGLGHYGIETTEYSLTGAKQLPELRRLIKRAYRGSRST